MRVKKKHGCMKWGAGSALKEDEWSSKEESLALSPPHIASCWRTLQDLAKLYLSIASSHFYSSLSLSLSSAPDDEWKASDAVGARST